MGRKKIEWILALAVLIAGIAALWTNKETLPKREASSATPEAIDPKVQAQRAKEENSRQDAVASALVLAKGLRASRLDPSSFNLEQVLKMDDGSLCFSFRSKNSFNAVVPGSAVFSGGIMRSSEDQDFNRLWKRSCAGKSGSDLTYSVRRLL